MNELNIKLVQTDVIWEDSSSNLIRLSQLVDKITDPTDLIVLAEMFSTGFSMHPERCAEPVNGPAMQFMAAKAMEKGCLVIGSILTRDNDFYFNRLIAMRPDGSYDQYDKRHLFSIIGENEVIQAGSRKQIVHWKGWNILPLVCYDLRFPVWCKNSWNMGEYEYDLLVFPSNWPKSRAHSWKSLLVARAIENLAYVAGVNRIGTDPEGIGFSGDSMILDLKGNVISVARPGKTEIISAILSQSELRKFRDGFNVGPDWDHFTMEK
jgi:omega-amidase